MSLKKNVVANYLGQGWSGVMGLAFIPLYIQYLGMEAYGLIGLFALLSAWLNLANVGMTPTLSREMARMTAGAHTAESIRDLLRSLETLALIPALMIGASVWLASTALAENWLRAEELQQKQVASSIAIMGFVVAVKFVTGIYQGAILGLQKHVWYNATHASLATVRAVGAIGVLVWISPTIEAYFVWHGIIYFIETIIFAGGVYYWLPESKRSGQFSVGAVLRVWRFAIGTMTISFLALLLTQLDKMLLSGLLRLEEFGYYTLAATVVSGLSLIISPIVISYYPYLTELYSKNDYQRLADTYHRGAQLVTVMGGSAALVLLFFSENLMLLWTKDSTISNAVAPLVSILAVGTLANSLMSLPYRLQLAYGWTSLAVKLNIIAVALVVPAILWVVPKFGAIGAASIWVALNIGYFTISMHFMHLRVMPNEKWAWYIQDIAKPLTMAMACVVSSVVIMPNGLSKLNELLWIGGTAMAAVAMSTVAASRLRELVVRALKSY